MQSILLHQNHSGFHICTLCETLCAVKLLRENLSGFQICTLCAINMSTLGWISNPQTTLGQGLQIGAMVVWPQSTWIRVFDDLSMPPCVHSNQHIKVNATNEQR